MQHIKQHLTLSFHIREFECYNVMRRMANLSLLVNINCVYSIISSTPIVKPHHYAQTFNARKRALHFFLSPQKGRLSIYTSVML